MEQGSRKNSQGKEGYYGYYSMSGVSWDSACLVVWWPSDDHLQMLSKLWHVSEDLQLKMKNGLLSNSDSRENKQ